MSSTASSPISNSLQSLAVALAAGKATSRKLVEDCLAHIEAPDGEGQRVFIKVSAGSARAAADAADAARKRGVAASPYAGIPISIKDLFDIAGEVTTAGSVVLNKDLPAPRDAAAVARLRAAGFVFIGRTNMTEFAFSGLGLNPHYGTPLNPWDRATGRIAGGSSSGAAVSVTDGMAAAAIGTDTGGSCRIPAALCGCVGYKPTARRVPGEGAYPLSPSLDSIGPLAHTVSCCAILDGILAAEPEITISPVTLAGLRFAIPRSYVFDGISAEVATVFERATRLLARAGATIDEIAFAQLSELPDFYHSGGIPAAEAYAWHRERIESSGAQYDRRVVTRILRAREQGSNDYTDLLSRRRAFIERVTPTLAAYDALLMPTVPIVAPRIEELAKDEEYVRLNALILRNSSAVNFMDGCAISIPCHDRGEAPVGLTLFSMGGRDRRLLSIAAATEEFLRRAATGHPMGSS